MLVPTRRVIRWSVGRIRNVGILANTRIADDDVRVSPKAPRGHSSWEDAQVAVAASSFVSGLMHYLQSRSLSLLRGHMGKVLFLMLVWVAAPIRLESSAIGMERA